MSQDDKHRTFDNTPGTHAENQHNRCTDEERRLSGLLHVVLFNHSSSALDLQRRFHSENTDSLRLVQMAPACGDE